MATKTLKDQSAILSLEISRNDRNIKAFPRPKGGLITGLPINIILYRVYNVLVLNHDRPYPKDNKSELSLFKGRSCEGCTRGKSEAFSEAVANKRWPMKHE